MSERSRGNCESWLAAGIPSAVSLFLGNSALAQTTPIFDRFTTSGDRTTLGGQAAPLDAGPISVQFGVQTLLEGSVEYSITNGTCTFTNSGSYSAATEPSHGMLSYGTLDHTVQSGDTCNGHTFPYAVVYYTWTDGQTSDTEDTFAVKWTTPDGTTGGPYDYEVELANPAIRGGIKYNGANIATNSEATPVLIGQQVVLNAYPPGGQWVREDGNPISGFNATPSSCEAAACTPDANFSNPTAMFYWYKPSSTPSNDGTYSLEYDYQDGNGMPASVTARFRVTGPVNVSVPNFLVADFSSLLFSPGEVDSTGKRHLPIPAEYPWLPARYIECGFTTCIVFAAHADQPATGGSFEWVQTLQKYDVDITRRDGGVGINSITPGLDNNFPYAKGPVTADAPASVLESGALEGCAIGEKIDFRATMYLLWKPNPTDAAPNSIYVPLGHLAWSWSALAQRYDKERVEYQWHVRSTDVSASPFEADSTYPIWDHDSYPVISCYGVVR